MPAFEPSTWAEVTEAAATLKAPDEHPFVTQIRSFTQSPEQFVTHVHTNSKLQPEQSDALPRARTKRPDAHFDDLLGYGRVDLERETFVRRNTNPSEDIVLPVGGDGVINPSAPQFNPALYLARVHADSTKEQLREGRNALVGVRKRLEEEVETYRKEKFVAAAVVEAAFESTKMSLLPLSPFDEAGSGRETERIFERAEALLKKRYEDVMQRETRLARLQRTLAVFQRYEWVFNLGERMRTTASEDLTSIEEVMREYARGVKWLDAQDAGCMTLIQDDVDDGFRILVDSVVSRLSNAHCTRSEASRLVAVLTSVRKEDLLSDALAKRMSFAQEGLQKALRSMDLSSVMGEGSISEQEAGVLVTRVSSGFYDGLWHVWRLGRVLMSHDRWLRIVDDHIVRLCDEYAKILRKTLLDDASLISQTAVKEIASVHMKSVSELQIPEACLGPLEEVSTEVIESFITSLSKAVRAGSEQVASQSTKNDTVGIQSAQLLQALVIEALSQVDASMFKGKEGLDEKSPSSRKGPDDEPRTVKFDQSPSTVDVLGSTCAEAPAIFAKTVYRNVSDSRIETDLASLKVAICCSELNSRVVPSIVEHMQVGSPFDARPLQRELKTCKETISDIKEKALSTYVSLVSPPLQTLASSLAAFPEDEVSDSVSRTVPIKIEGVSKSANELVLQLALVMITVRKRSTQVELIRHILLQLISEVGSTLVQVLSTDKLAYHRAAQLWVDVTYMQEMVTKGANAEAKGVQDSLDGFSRVKERAVQAVLADGYSFSLADMQMLKDSVVAGGMEESSMLCECFAETWELLREHDDHE